MTTEEGLLAAILANPECDLPRLALADHDVPQLVVATAFGVSVTTVSDIVRGKRWKK